MTDLFLTLLELSGGTAVIIFVVWLLSPRINRVFTVKWKYWLWLLLAVRLLVPFNPSFVLPSAPVEVSIPNASITLPAGNPTPAVQVQPQMQQAQMPITPSALTTVDVLMLVWAAGVLIFLVWQIVRYHAFRRRINRWSCPVQNNGFAAKTKRQVQAELGIKSNISLLLCKEVCSPMMIGFFRPILLLPHEEYNEQEMRFILYHELTHFQRRDIWYKALMLLANAVHWFNPAVWLMVRCASRDLEISCDAAVVSGCDREMRRLYSETILAVVHRKTKAATALSTHFYGGKTMLKERFTHILSTKKRRKGIAAFAAVLLCAALLCGMVACSAQETDNADNADVFTDFSATGYAADFHMGNRGDTPVQTGLATEADVEAYQRLLTALDADDAVCFEAIVTPYKQEITVELTREQVAAVMDLLHTAELTASEPTTPADDGVLTLYIQTPEERVHIRHNESWLVVGRAGEETALIFDGAACAEQFSAIRSRILDILDVHSESAPLEAENVSAEAVPEIGIMTEAGTTLLSDADAAILADLLENGQWTDSTADCLCDYSLSVLGEEILYHSDCGTFNDYVHDRSLSLGDSEQQQVNAILAACLPPDSAA